MNNKQWVNLFFIGLFLLVIISLISSFFLHDKFQESSLRNKEYLIKENKPKIIFAGDSRAERQLSVSTALDVLSYSKGDIINIAISSGDPIALNYLVDKYPVKFKNAVIVLSVSANQLNDNSKSRGYFTNRMISKLSYKEKIITFIPNNISTLLGYYYSIVRPHLTTKSQFRESYGFNPIDGTLHKKSAHKRSVEKNPWYEDYVDGGLKHKLIGNSLSELSNKVKELYVYTAPFAPSYLAAMKEGRTLSFERSFKSKITSLCNKYNLTCINYLKVDELDDLHFYDGAHTNKDGAIIFTKKIIKDFRLIE